MGTLHASRPLNIGEVTLITIENTDFQSNIGKAGIWLSGCKQAYAIIVCDTKGIRAFNTIAEAIDIDTLMDVVPELGHLLDKGL